MNFIEKTRYVIARYLILIGIRTMPDSFYKRELVKRLYALRVEVEQAIKEAIKNAKQ